MPDRDVFSRRLHPKLRVYRNSDDIVNAMRAEASTCVASTRDSAPSPRTPGLDIAQAQLAVQASAPIEELERPRGRLRKQQKLEERPPPKSSFVNVFIELVPSRKFNGRSAAQAMRKILNQASKQLKADKAPNIKGAVLDRRNMVSATIPVTYLKQLEANPSVAFVHAADPLRLDLPTPKQENRRKPQDRSIGSKNLHKDGRDTLIGIIDVGGFDFAHPDFLDESGKTRFVAIWDQGAQDGQPPKWVARDANSTLDYGHEIAGKRMDAAIKAAKRKGSLPASYLEPQSHTVEGAHGTHVASIAAGNLGVCRKAMIAGVLIDVPQLDDTRERRRATFSDSSRIAHAVEYLLALAKREKRALSINISLGTNGGAHDGSSGVSRWIDALLSTPGRSVCVAAGNAGQEAPRTPDDLGWVMGRIHTEGRIVANGLDVDIEWTVAGNGVVDVSENELEIWYSCQDRFTVKVKPPSGDWFEIRPRNFIENMRLPGGTYLSVYNELYHPTNGANYVSLYLSPHYEPGNIRGIQAGVWTVRLHGDEVKDGRFHGWIERDDPVPVAAEDKMRLFRFPSFFSVKSNIDSHSINSLACGHRVIAVANLDEPQQKIDITSSQGPTRDNRPKPDIAAPGTDIVAANGFGSRNAPWVSMSGTSMASPYVTGVIGLMLSANPSLSAAQCLGILQRTAQPLPGASYDWRNDSGFGRISPEDAVKEAATFNQRQEIKRRGSVQ